MQSLRLPQKLYHILRVASAMCFIGHGAFGIITKQIWCNYFAVFGIQEKMAYQLMPVVGVVDIVFGLILLFYPVRFVAAWLVGWGVLTALLRPLSGEPFAETIERAGNYGAPLVLLMLARMKGLTCMDWFTRMQPPVEMTEKQSIMVIKSLELFGFMLLLGHGWLNLLLKKGLLSQYAELGFSNPIQVAQIVGILEIVTALSIIIKPIRLLIFLLFIWKMTSELLYPHYGIFEWVERGGSYGVLLALWLALRENKALKIDTSFFSFRKQSA